MRDGIRSWRPRKSDARRIAIYDRKNDGREHDCGDCQKNGNPCDHLKSVVRCPSVCLVAHGGKECTTWLAA